MDEKPFFERAMKWKEKQDKEKQKKMDDSKMKVLENCTFKPHINASLITSHVQQQQQQQQQLADDSMVYDKLYHVCNLYTLIYY